MSRRHCPRTRLQSLRESCPCRWQQSTIDLAFRGTMHQFLDAENEITRLMSLFPDPPESTREMP